MKKKSPPYAIIGAAVLGIVAIMAYLSHEKAVQAQFDAAAAKAKADAQAAIDAANAAAANKQTAVVQESDTHMKKVLYATQPIQAGQRLNASFFDAKQTPDNLMPDAYTDANSNDIIGYFATRPIEKGDPLTPRNVRKSMDTMSMRIPPGMRAISLSVFNADENKTGGFIVDGDKVDLLATTVSNTDNSLWLKTEMIQQNVEVLYVPGPPTRTDKTEGIQAFPPPGDAIAVTFLVTPEQAQVLLAISEWKNVHISMILRSRRDTTEVKVKPFSADDYNASNLKKIQTMTDKSIKRVEDLQTQIEEQEKQAAQGTTNAPPTPPPAP